MPKVTFVTQSSRSADDIGFSPERVVNMYPEAGPQGAKGVLLLRPVLGRTLFADTSTPITRAMEYLNGNIYMVSGGSLFSIAEGGTVTNVGTVGDSEVTTISSNGNYITVAAAQTYSVWDGTAMTTPGSGRITNVGSVAHLDHYTLLTEYGGDEHEWTTLTDPTTRNALYYATNESKNDDTLLVMQDGSYAWYFGEESAEVWYNTGEAGADAFTRLSGGAIDTGLMAANLAAKTEAGIFFVGDDKVAYITSGVQMQAVSTASVNQAINAETPTHCFYYEDRGHRFCVIRFDNRPAWVMDMSTGLWHERSSGVNLGAWDVIAACRGWDDWYCATTDGTVYKMDRSNTDVTSALLRTLVSSSVYVNGEYFSVNDVELLGEFGESTSESELTICLSRDAGRTFGSPIYRSAGVLGERMTRINLRALGSYRDFSFKVEMSDAADLNIYSDANIGIG